MSESNLQILARVAAALRRANVRAVFVGVATISLYLDPVAASRVRSTLDVDCVVPAATRSEYRRIEAVLQAHGFSPSSEEGAPLCCWTLDGEVTVDVLPTSSEVLGFGNRFHAAALATAEEHIVEGQVIAVAPVALALAMKVEAYRARGAPDPIASRDLEDAVALLDGNARSV